MYHSVLGNYMNEYFSFNIFMIGFVMIIVEFNLWYELDYR